MEVQAAAPIYKPGLQRITQGRECFMQGCESFIRRLLMIYAGV